jgi:hypothetical protein
MLPREMYDAALNVLTGKLSINPGQPAIIVTVPAESLLSCRAKLRLDIDTVLRF